MIDSVNLAEKYAKKVDERFSRESQAMLALSNDYEFTGASTVKVYSIPVAPMGDYTRSGANRYGSPVDLSRNVQVMKVNRDRSFTFIIDKGDKIQSEMVEDAGKALSRQLKEVVVPEFDTYVFKTLAEAAQENGHYAGQTVSKENAYACFLAGMEALGNANVPDKGRVAFCTYRFANQLKQDPAFMRSGDDSQEMILKGVIGEVDGCRIVKVPANHMPAGAAFLLTHSVAAMAPKQLSEYKIHDNPPGISGYLVEGRFIYDVFVLNEKADAVYYHGGQGILKSMNVICAAKTATTYTLSVNGEKEQAGNQRYYMQAAKAEDLTGVQYGTAITVSAWTELEDGGKTVTAGSNRFVRVVEVDSANKPVAVGDGRIALGK